MTKSRESKIVTSKNLNFTPFDVKFIPSSTRIVSLGQNKKGTGTISISRFDGKSLTTISEFEKRSAFKCGTFKANNLRLLATGDFDGKLSLWDLERCEVPIATVKGHQEMINSIDGCHVSGDRNGRPEVASASRDGLVKIWDLRQEAVPVMTIAPEDSQNKRDCWAVSFGQSTGSDEMGICCGYDNGDLMFFDLRTMSMIWSVNLGSKGICSLDFDFSNKKDCKMAFSGVNGLMGLLDLNGGEMSNLHQSKEDDSTTFWSCQFNPLNQKEVLSVNGQGELSLYQQEGNDGLKRIQSNSISKYPITCANWSKDIDGLIVAADLGRGLHISYVQ